MSVIIDGVFYPDKKSVLKEGNANYKKWHMQRQREDHSADILQRRKEGKPNSEWIRTYPEEAKMQYSESEIRKYGNQY